MGENSLASERLLSRHFQIQELRDEVGDEDMESRLVLTTVKIRDTSTKDMLVVSSQIENVSMTDRDMKPGIKN